MENNLTEELGEKIISNFREFNLILDKSCLIIERKLDQIDNEKKFKNPFHDRK